MKTNKNATPKQIADFMELAMKEKLFVSNELRRKITREVDSLFFDGLITKNTLSKYQKITKELVRKI